MDTAALKGLNESLRQLATMLKRCRSHMMVVDGYARLNHDGSGGVSTALGELHAAADELQRNARAYQRAIADVAASMSREEGLNVDNQPS